MLSEPVSPIWTFHFKFFFFNRVIEWKVPQGDRGRIHDLDPWKKYMCLLSLYLVKVYLSWRILIWMIPILRSLKIYRHRLWKQMLGQTGFQTCKPRARDRSKKMIAILWTLQVFISEGSILIYVYCLEKDTKYKNSTSIYVCY